MGKCQGQNNAGNEHDPRESCLACPGALWSGDLGQPVLTVPAASQAGPRPTQPGSQGGCSARGAASPHDRQGSGDSGGPRPMARWQGPLHVCGLALGLCPWPPAGQGYLCMQALGWSPRETYDAIQMTTQQCCGQLGMRWDAHQAGQGRCPPLTDTVYSRCPDQTNHFALYVAVGASRGHPSCVLLWICGHLLAAHHRASLGGLSEVPGFSEAAAAGSCSKVAFHIHFYK